MVEEHDAPMSANDSLEMVPSTSRISSCAAALTAQTARTEGRSPFVIA